VESKVVSISTVAELEAVTVESRVIALATAGAAHVASPRQNVEAEADVPELRFATGKLPVTPVVNGSPVALVSVPLAGVPIAGVVNTGDVKVLFVNVVVLVAVTMLFGVMIVDSVDMNAP
jgi:hypothetical protein